MALAAARKRQTVPKISDEDCLGMEAKLQQLRQSLALEKAARSKLEAKLYVTRPAVPAREDGERPLPRGELFASQIHPDGGDVAQRAAAAAAAAAGAAR